MRDVVADDVSVATDASVPRSSDTRAALKYLEASGANAISITTGSGHVVIAVGYKADAVAAFWLLQDRARAVAAKARGLMAGGADVEGAVAALREAAVQLRVTLTAHDVAMARAGAAAHRLDAIVETLRACGMMREFTRQYKLRRAAATARGEGFMSYGNAELRLKRALLPLIQNGGKPVIGASLFAQVFNTKQHR
jgi:hypothetical protein